MKIDKLTAHLSNNLKLIYKIQKYFLKLKKDIHTLTKEDREYRFKINYYFYIVKKMCT